ncbi:MAG: penicillin-binding protein 2 [Gemmatimonadetes bacterium]|nr:penicillin-binding protein 2 [Gemmatimonadota bacterium]
MRLFQPDTRQRRTMCALFAISFVVATLLTAFFQTQVVSGSQYMVMSEDNRLRPVVIPAPRGTIYDRNGEIVATSIPGFAVMLMPGTAEVIKETLVDLQPFLGLANEDIEKLLETRAGRPHDLLEVTTDATFSQVATLEERRTSFPNLLVVDRPKRYYPAGAAIGHMIGYVAEISKEQLQLPEYKEAEYQQGRWIGKAGLEKQYEFSLSGTDGARYVEVDARGKVIGMLAPEQAKKPKAGKDIRLTLDLDLQRFAHSIFPKGMNGAIVAMVPSTGEVLALYSHPTFDPNELVRGISPQLWTSLNTDSRRPLLNRATAGIYAPGSTFKLATALIGLERGVITPETKMPYGCSGGMSYAGRYSRCWKKEGHGSLDLAAAIQHSCNVYFYQLGIWLGLSQLSAEGTRLGFSRTTGIDLPTEEEGTFPAGTEWYRKRFGWTPTPSEVMSLAIGQGPNAQTPLRMTQFFSALAGNGTAPSPHLIVNSASARALETDLRVSRPTLVAVREGMARVTEPGGTAYMSSLKRWKLYGKTGTSQNSQDLKRPHAWFAGFAGPRDRDPEIAVAAIVEFGEHGSSAAAPLAAKIADFYLNKKHGFKTDPTQQTLAERLGVKPE